ncbi:MAG: hypothetical protein ACETWG_05440 [Candidatus Neomarinimicrobiota bacterium]
MVEGRRIRNSRAEPVEVRLYRTEGATKLKTSEFATAMIERM